MSTAPTTARRNAQRTARRIRDYIILTVLALVFIAPIYYLIIGSFKPSQEVLAGFSGFLPTDLSFANYGSVIASLSSDSTGYFYQFMLNSFLISAAIVAGGLIVNSMAAYSFARLRWRGRDRVFVVVILLVIVPFQAVAIPLVYLLAGMRDTLFVQIIPFIANAFSIYLFYTFFLGLPTSIEEAARLDGLGPAGTFFRIVVPISRPVFATVAILTFLSSWGQFLWPSLTTSDPAVRPLPLEMSVFSGQSPVDWGSVFAFGTLLVLPILVVFLAFQRFFVQSVAGSAVKG
ncbi:MULTISPECIES: carbohydrate ABC transporter permease [Arthrobacter]|uniref:Carbohydrate ABC transporter permease n=1 Tax=Arthrobacter terricola TaxID=2547396 RepID=A0A4R5K7V3_9MICC|nr:MULTISPECIES: carbohydrate ABC transporter permease [Arthrobacter]MBT8163280.1 carbohydrate ABC transporter permease [Arthrobacter sp. GN70]TDF91193.1 carbohydrate ABC transporter permease [Arthrobacter terricola]